MADLTLAAGPRMRHAGFFEALFRREPLFAVAALLHLALIPPTLVAMALDTRTLLGVNVWVKPLKFEIALAVYLATLAWYAVYLPRGVADRSWYRVFSAAVVIAIAAETAWVVGAAANGVPSHFNVASPLMRNLYGLMGVFAILLTSTAMVYGVLIIRNQQSGLARPMRLALGLGLILTFVLTIVAASVMAAGTGHAVGGGAGSDPAGLAVFGWLRDAGDLRVAHFFATHALHFIPAAGLMLAWVLPARAASAGVVIASVLYTGLVGATFAEALAGRPFLAILP